MKKSKFFSDILTLEAVRVLLLFVFVFIISLLYTDMSEDIKKYTEETGFEEGSVYKGNGIITSLTEKDTYIEIIIIPDEERSYIAEEKLLLRIYKDEFTGSIPDDTYTNTLCRYEFVYEPLQEAANYGDFNSREYYNSLGIAGVFRCNSIAILKRYSTLNTYIMKVKSYMEDNIYEFMGSKYGSIMSAMVLGNKYAMDTETKELYNRNGLAHVLAVSGLHIATVGTILYNILRKFMSVKIGATISIVVMFLYGILTGGSVSCMRAVIMFIIKQGSLITGRKYNIYNSIFISAIIILLLNPFYIKNSSFIMSYTAIISVTVIMPEVSYILGKLKNKYIDLFMPLITGIILNVVMLPLVCMYYYEVPVLSVLLNLFVIPLMTVVLMSGLICGITGDVLEISGYVSGYVGKLFLWVFEKLCNLAEGISGTVVVTGKPQLKEVIIFYLVIVFIYMLLRWVRIVIRRKEGFRLKSVMFTGMVAAVLLMFFISLVSVVYNTHITGEEVFVSFIDVGQGDSIFIKDTEDKTYLVDCGSSSVSNVGRYSLSPHLKALGVDKIDYAFVTHGDIDHISGITELLSDKHLMKVDNLVIADCQKEDESLINLIQLGMENEVNIIYIQSGITFKSGDLYINCLYPDSGLDLDDSNEKSLVLSVEYKEFSMLLTGDIGSDTERKILEKCSEEIKDVDILKVAHHGSKYSSSAEFLEVASPMLSIISCSENNLYGHPSPETLARLQDVGSMTLATKDAGGIMVKVGNEIRIYR